jgi:hypothetical protein
MEHCIYNIQGGCGLTRANLYIFEDNTFKFDFYSHWMGTEEINIEYFGKYKKLNDMMLLQINDEIDDFFTFTLLNELIYFEYPDKEHEGMVMGNCNVNVLNILDYNGCKYDSILECKKECTLLKHLSSKQFKMINVKKLKKLNCLTN